MSSPAGLLSCSNETLANIFSDEILSKKDLRSLRLISKELCPAATREFAKRYVTNPFFFLSRYGLQSLIDICKHPIFGPEIRSIGFLATKVHISGLKEHVSDAGSIAKHDSNSSSMVDSLTIISDYARILKEKALLAASGDTKELLTTALQALRQPISITIANDLDFVGPGQAIGLPLITHYYDGNFNKPITCIPDLEVNMKSSLKLIEKVIAKLSTKDHMLLTGLKLKMRRHSQDTPNTSDPSRLDSIIVQSISGAYSSLTTFHLELDLESLRCSSSFGSFEELLKAVPNLQVFAFETSCTDKRPVGMSTLERVAKLFSFETNFELRVLILQNVPCTLESLQLLMERHKKTLEHVKLSKITLLGSWKACLRGMRKELDLQRLQIADPYTISRDNTTSRGVFLPKQQTWRAPTTNSFEGKENTRTGLDNLIRRTP
ncbi:unnamed protein product [Aureobasidium mustum]|uniref:Uncharacterized protein n=1 Tax=Aureobasidium mustum TaxID=2773714 RepID=A0A9N8JJE2_9PEZI|nr:unnamed protein product [Aureobasidium mustum]